MHEWPGKDEHWFRTFVAEVNASYRALEALHIPTVAAVKGAAFGGGYGLALACDLILAADTAIFRCVEVTTAMLPIAGAVPRLAERIGRARAARLVRLGEAISGSEAAALGIMAQVVPAADLVRATAEVARHLSTGSNARLCSHARAAEGVVEWRPRRGGCADVGPHDGPLQERGRGEGLRQHRAGVRRGGRASGDDVRR